MLKKSCKATRFNYNTHGCKPDVNTFYMKAGWPGQRAIRLVRLRRINWQAFFSISAFYNNTINTELT